MAYQAIFKRYEIKYLLTQHQKQTVLAAMKPYMALDRYGRTTIRNIYFDTENYRLIRRSIEKPAYKEKLRIRSYQKANSESPVFVELKKKYNSIVYKRRLAMPEKDAMAWICRVTPRESDSQIAAEINYVLDYYETLRPTVFLSYEREAYYALDGSDFRITFDDHILSRQDNLSLESEVGGTPLLPEGNILMEIKTSGGIPLWMTHVLTQERIFKTSFSKYGTAYQTTIFPEQKGSTTTI
ncbi:MAG: polyphosphate polymerase domain-containing protein [Lachnospiraceae bacterium]|nr:polyphosphate polymerase domain-containing protein [Lachnospiraceae bacterium]